jgi:chaperone required for assembly of F1-ATPase
MPIGLTATMTETEQERLERISKDRMQKPLPKRFYKDVGISDGLGILLDGRAVKTPLKKALVIPNAAMAEAVAEEWRAQVDVINPALMPITKLANTALDRATAEREHVLNEIVQYAGTDLVCYWADRPPELVALQKQHWQPVLDWAAATLGEAFRVSSGIRHVQQKQSVLNALRARVEKQNEWQLTAMYLLMTLTGSTLLALQLVEGATSAEAAWTAANVEEDYQVSQWGEDWEAKIRREARWREYDGLVRFLQLIA